MKVLSVYDGFFVGGSRIVHSSIITGLNNMEDQEHRVISLTNRVEREGSIQFIHDTPSYAFLTENGISVHSLNRTPDDNVTKSDLNILQEMIDWADLILVLKEQPLTILKQVKVNKPVILSVHRSDPINQGPGLLEAVDSGLVNQLISCGYSVKNIYEEYGINKNIIKVVENGIDINKFIPNELTRVEKRLELGIPIEAPVILQAARFDTMKNIPLFVESAEIFIRNNPDAHIVMCGAGMTVANPDFANLVKNIPSDNLHSLGIVKNMETIYPIADIISLTSAFGEAAPLCILEGLACNVIPVATNIGDTTLLVADCGLITPLDSQIIVKQWERVLAHKYEFISRIDRNKLSQDRMINDYYQIIKNTIMQ